MAAGTMYYGTTSIKNCFHIRSTNPEGRGWKLFSICRRPGERRDFNFNPSQHNMRTPGAHQYAGILRQPDWYVRENSRGSTAYQIEIRAILWPIRGAKRLLSWGSFGQHGLGSPKSKSIINRWGESTISTVEDYHDHLGPKPLLIRYPYRVLLATTFLGNSLEQLKNKLKVNDYGVHSGAHGIINGV